MKRETVLEWINREMVIAIIRGVEPGQMLDTARAIKAGGISNMEITFDHSTPEGIGNTLESIRRVKAGLGDQVNVGVGTVLTTEEAELAAEAGAEYLISPGMDPAVIRRTKELGKISIPGALTPTEVCEAWDCGADIVKMFPAGVLGLEYLKAVRGPLRHIPMCTVGGINPENIGLFLEAGIRCFGIGGNLVSVEAVRRGDFHKLTQAALGYRQAICRGQENGRGER